MFVLKVGVTFPYHRILTHRQFCIICMLVLRVGFTFPYHKILTHRKLSQVSMIYGCNVSCDVRLLVFKDIKGQITFINVGLQCILICIFSINNLIRGE